MATRNQVLSLFGATPEQIRQKQLQEQQQAIFSQQDPYARLGTALGTGLGRLFGGESAEMAQARQMQEAVSGVDPNDPQALRTLAQSVSQFAPQQALQIAAYASELEKSQMGSVEQVPIQIGTTQEPVTNDFGLPVTDADGNPVMKTVPQFRNFPMERTPDGFKRIEGVQYPDSPAMGGDTSDTPDTQTTVPDYIVDPDTKELVPNPVKTSRGGVQSQEREVTTNVPAEAQERISMQSSPRGGTEGALGQINIPVIEGERTYINPEQAKVESDRIRNEIARLKNSNDPNKKEKIRELNKERMRIQKMRIASRRRGPSEDLTEQVRNLKRRLPENSN